MTCESKPEMNKQREKQIEVKPDMSPAQDLEPIVDGDGIGAEPLISSNSLGYISWNAN